MLPARKMNLQTIAFVSHPVLAIVATPGLAEAALASTGPLLRNGRSRNVLGDGSVLPLRWLRHMRRLSAPFSPASDWAPSLHRLAVRHEL